MNDAKVVATFLLALGVSAFAGYAFGRGASTEGPVVGSIWHENVMQQRAVEPDVAQVVKKIGTSALLERVEATSALLPGRFRGYGLAPGRDGLRLRVGATYVYFTPTDLVSAQAYDRGEGTSIGLTFGVDFAKVDALAKARLGDKMPREPAYERVRFGAPYWSVPTTAPALDASVVGLRARAYAAADYLTRISLPDGTFRYEIRATTMEDAKDYNWVRHAGTSWFLARAARTSGSEYQRNAAFRTTRALRTNAYQACGAFHCIGKGENEAELGATALGLLAFLEFDRPRLTNGDKAEPGPALFSLEAPQLAAFLLAAQKPNGDFQHQYDRGKGVFVDRYRMYYTGEATLALARYGALSSAPDAGLATDAASRALTYLATSSWNFPGSRYYASEEHWTCQALEALWDKAPNEAALTFCLHWAEIIRAQRIRDGEGPAEDVGASRVAPIMAPRLTPVASRTEALVAILAVLRRAGRLPAEQAHLAEDVRAALGVLAHHQLGYGQPTSVLLANPAMLHGGFPTSRTLWDVRIDSVQHAGNAFLNFAAEEEGLPLAAK